MGPNYDKIRDQTITPMPTQIQMPEQTTENGEGVNETVPGSAGIMQAVVLYSRGGDHYADSETSFVSDPHLLLIGLRRGEMMLS